MLEAILTVVLIWGGMFFIGWIINTISDFSKKHKEEIRDRVAGELLAGMDIKAVIEDYKNKLAYVNGERIDFTENYLEKLKLQLWGKNAVLLKDCPECKEGHLMVRKGKYGKFLGCTKYPKCKYTNNISEARQEYKETINEQIVGDIQRAYSNELL
jgi:hypothetical protein